MKFLYPGGPANEFSTDNLSVVSKLHPSFPYLSLEAKAVVTEFLKKKKVCDLTPCLQ